MQDDFWKIYWKCRTLVIRRFCIFYMTDTLIFCLVYICEDAGNLTYCVCYSYFYIHPIGTILFILSSGITIDDMHRTAPSPVSSGSDDKTEKFFRAVLPGSALFLISTGYSFPLSSIRRSISFPLLSL